MNCCSRARPLLANFTRSSRADLPSERLLVLAPANDNPAPSYIVIVGRSFIGLELAAPHRRAAPESI